MQSNKIYTHILLISILLMTACGMRNGITKDTTAGEDNSGKYFEYSNVVEYLINTQTPFQPDATTSERSQLADSDDLSENSFQLGTAFEPDPALETEMKETLEDPNLYEPSLDFYGIDFGNGKEQITIKIIPRDQTVNNGKPILFSFLPKEGCKFGTKKACIYAYKTGTDGNIIMISVHSGVGGEAQTLRNAIEGTWINSSAFNLKKIHSKLRTLEGSQVVISQGEHEVRDLGFIVGGRIPAEEYQNYLKTPIYDALRFASELDEDFSRVIYPDRPQIVIETCGWKLRGEARAPGLTDTSASIYLGVVQKVN